MEILPGVLAYDEADFKARILHPGLQAVAKTFHVDVLDGSLFHATCWAEARTVGSWNDVPDIELHCMVQSPLSVIEDWKDHVPSLRRVIVHQEIGRNLPSTIARARQLQLEVMVAVNPGTPVDEIARLPIDGLLVMGVEPGASGQTFLGEPILSKVRRAKSLFPNLTVALDGGVSRQNIGSLAQTGLARCVASSALWKAEKPEEAYKILLSKSR